MDKQTYINLFHRMSGYSEEVITEYVRIKDIEDMGDITMKDIYNPDTIKDLYHLEKRMKIQRLLDNITTKPVIGNI